MSCLGDELESKRGFISLFLDSYTLLMCQRQQRDFSERIGVTDGEVCQNLTIQFNFRLFQTVDQFAVAQTVQTGSRVDADDPQTAQITGTGAAVTVRVEQALEHRFIG